MIVSINQPAYLPWPGYFHRIAVSELHIVLDHVQYEKNSFTNRNKIRTTQGWNWLTVPLKTAGRFGHLAIDGLEISNEHRWAEKHWGALCSNYGRARYFTKHRSFLESVYLNRTWEYLGGLLDETTRYLLSAFHINTHRVFSSQLGVLGRKDELILNLCREVGASTYLSGPLGRNYLRESLFREAGIRIVYHEYVNPVYGQAHTGFEPGMSALDLLLNCGDEGKEVLMAQGQLLP